MRLTTIAAAAICIGVVTAILHPIIAHAKADRDTICISRNYAVAQAMFLYMEDNEEKFPPATYDPMPCDAAEKVWPEVIFPYHNDWTNYRCPADPAATPAGMANSPCTNLPTTQQWEVERSWAMRSSRGMNWLFLSPSIKVAGANGPIYSHTKPLSRVNRLDATLLFVDAEWERLPDGTPTGAGSWIVDPPCIRDSNNSLVLELPNFTASYFWQSGWEVSVPASKRRFGYAFPFHEIPKKGQEWLTNLTRRPAICTFTDGHAAKITMDAIARGCNVLNNSAGKVSNHETFLWDLR